MAYYDIFAAPVPKARRDEYQRFLERTHALMRAHGATEVVDLWGSDVPPGERTSLPLAVALEEGEEVAVGWTVWPSKEARDAGWAAMEAADMGEMPFDGARMIFGGFSEALVSRG